MSRLRWGFGLMGGLAAGVVLVAGAMVTVRRGERGGAGEVPGRGPLPPGGRADTGVVRGAVVAGESGLSSGSRADAGVPGAGRGAAVAGNSGLSSGSRADADAPGAVRAPTLAGDPGDVGAHRASDRPGASRWGLDGGSRQRLDDAPRPGRADRARAWAELLRISALFTVPGDALAGAAASGRRPNRGTALAIASSLCLYEAGMALNDYADRDIDAIERPHRPLPSGRIAPRAALNAAAALTAAGLGCAAAAGTPALLTAAALAGAVWAYDLRLKQTAAGPATMAAARALDLLLGAAATANAARGGAEAPTDGASGSVILPRDRERGGRGTSRGVIPGGRGSSPGPAPADPGPSVVRGATDAARGASTGGSRPVPAASASSTKPPAADALRRAGAPPRVAEAERPVDGSLTAAALIAAHTYAVTRVSRREAQGGDARTPLAALAATAAVAGVVGRRGGRASGVAAAAYAGTAARPYAHAALNPSPLLTQRAVGGGIRALIPLQAALAARAGDPRTAAALAAAAPLARRLARKVSVT